jgi:signal transduction protein with GAF and PtsI domain
MSDVPGNEIQRLQTLLETVRLLNSTLELKELTGIILEVVRAEIAVERISVFVVDRSRNTLQALVTQGMEDEALSLPVGVGIAGTVAATGEVLDILDAYADPRFDRRFDGKSGYYTNDLFALPVCNRNGDVVGVLELLNRLRPISATDREFLLGISVYIGLALENSVLHAQVLAGEHLETAPRPEMVQSVVVGQADDPMAFAMRYLHLIPDERDLPAAAWFHLESFRRGLNEAVGAAVQFKKSVEQLTNGLMPINLSDEVRQLSQSRAEQWERNNIQATLVAENALPVYAHEFEMRLVLSFLIRHAEDAILQSNSDRHLRIHSWSTGRNALVSIHHKVSGGGLEQLTPGFEIANSIVQKHRGHIRFESSLEKGTTFLIELPVIHDSRLAE